MKFVVGIDFDNTIVSYDTLFHKVALEQDLIPKSTPQKKENIRDYLRQSGKEDDWTKLQGYVYGSRMDEASPFPGILEFFKDAIQKGLTLYIISHKTKYPYMGYKYDLHMAAKSWLINKGFFEQDKIGLSESNVFFEVTKEDKLNRLKSLGCNVFIDDLPEILNHAYFPGNCKKVLFSTKGKTTEYVVLNSWENLGNVYKTIGYE